MADVQNRRTFRVGRFKDAIVFPFANIGSFAKLALFPALIAGALSYLVLRAFWPVDASFDSQEEAKRFMEALNPAINIVYLIVTLAGAVVAVGIHRFIIRGEQPGWVILRLRWYELAYILVPLVFILVQAGIWIVVALVALGAAAAVDPALVGQVLRDPAAIQDLEGTLPGSLGLVAIVAFIALFVLVLWTSMRLVLMFPHAAVEGSLSPRFSWRAMKGNVWRFGVATGLFGLATLLPSTLIMAAVAALVIGPNPGHLGPFSPGTLGFVVIPALVGIFISAMAVALLSYIYKDLVTAPAGEARV
jgi:uncharacterized membrane protein YhdT